MKNKSIILALLFVAAGSLQADTISYTNAVTMSPLSDATVHLNKFDTQGGFER